LLLIFALENLESNH